MRPSYDFNYDFFLSDNIPTDNSASTINNPVPAKLAPQPELRSARLGELCSGSEDEVTC